MARGRSSAPAVRQPAQLTPDEMRRGIARLNVRISDVEQFDPGAPDSEREQLEAAIDDSLEQTFGRETSDFHRYSPATWFDKGPLVVSTSWSGGRRESRYRYIAAGKEQVLALLRRAVKSLEERLAEHGSVDSAPSLVPTAQQPTVGRKVFVVHGHDVEVKEAVARLLQALQFEPVILGEEPNGGMTVIEKFEKHSDVGYAVVLLTPDDQGSKEGEPLKPRARQNVVLELGYFIGKLGRPRVCTIVRPGVEMPSDVLGLVHTPYDQGEAWRLKVAKELRAAGYDVDLNAL